MILSACTDASFMFNGCSSLREVSGILDLSACTKARGMFKDCPDLQKIPDVLELSSCTDTSSMFNWCRSLVRTPDILDLSSCTNANDMFESCTSMESVGIKNLKVSMKLDNLYRLSRENLLSILNSLQTVTGQTLTLGASLMLRLTEEDKLIATAKGWTLA